MGQKLIEAAPPWAALLARRGASEVDWIAAPPLPSGTATPAVIVRTSIEGGLVYAAEAAPGTQLPVRCPELHINADSSFCLGRRAYRTRDTAEVAIFWQDLGEFLVNIHHALRRRRWPAGRWLSHGPIAADRQAEAEAAAAAIGMAKDYALCLEAGEGWVADGARRARGRIAAKAPCPRGCRDALGHTVPFRACQHRADIQAMVTAERARRIAQANYFRSLRLAGAACCGRIAGCPLQARQAA